MKRNNIVIGDILKKTKLTSLKSLKNELKIKKNSSLIRFLTNYLISSVENINYSTDADELVEIIRVLSCIKPDNENDFQIIETNIKQLKEVIQKKKHIFKKNQTILKVLTLLDEKTGSFLIETRFEMLNKKVEIKQFPSIDDKKLKSVICDFIFKYKDYGHLSFLISLYPNACNIKSNNRTIVISILKNYLSKPLEREFLSKVITLFVSNVNFKLTEEEKNEIYNLCNNYIPLLNTRDLFFIKEVISFIGIKNELAQENNLELLKTRFGLQNSIDGKSKLSYNVFPTDMTDRDIITIDCGGAIVKDDAFSIEKKADGTIELGIYITDVSAIKKDSQEDKYAYNHFASIYVKDNWIPMLPEPLVYKFSLDKGVRRVIAFTYKFSPSFELLDFQIEGAVIRVKKNLVYSDVERIVNDGGDTYEMLKDAIDLTEAIGDSLGTIDKYHHIKELTRELGGSLNEIPEKYLDTPGSRVIATLSVFLNNYIATLFDKSGLPFIYRINDFESADNIKEQLRRYRQDKVICEMLKSIQTYYKPSTFSSVNTGHKGLGLNAYTQVTNPARLYPSLVIQRMLIDLYIDKISIDEYVEKYNNVEEQAKNFTILQERNRDFTNEYNKLCRKIK